MARVIIENKIESMRPFLPYYGGKQRMAHNIIPLIPRHTVYVEPFVGGAAILFMKPYPKITNEHNYREIINDMDKQLINFYRVLQLQREEFIKRIRSTLCSKVEFNTALKIIKFAKNYSVLDRAWAYYVTTVQSFANTGKGWACGIRSTNHAVRWNVKKKHLIVNTHRIERMYIEYDHALNCIKKWDSPHTCFYCDPPYPETEQTYAIKFGVKEFQMLVKILDKCQGSFLLSCYENSKIKIPNDWERFQFKANNTASGQGNTRKSKSKTLGDRERTEILYRRFNRVPVDEKIQKLYDSGKYDCFVTKKD